MKENPNTVSDIFVQKLYEKRWLILTREDLFEMWLRAWGMKLRFPYGLGQVKNRGVIKAIGGGIYRVSLNREEDFSSSAIAFAWNDRNREQEENIDTSYWQIISLLSRRYSPSGGIIAHEKSLEYHLRNYEIPKRIVVYTRDTDKRLQISWYEIHFRTLKTWEKSGAKNMYRILYNASFEWSIDGVNLRFLSLEASLLDVASLRIHESGIAEDLILRFLSKYEKKLSRGKLGELVQYRYIRAINRIRSLSKEHWYADLYTVCLDVIKKEWGWCYLNL